MKEIGTAFTKAGSHEIAPIFTAGYAEAPEDFSAWLASGRRFTGEQIGPAREAISTHRLRPDNPVPWHNLGLLASDRGLHENRGVIFSARWIWRPTTPRPGTTSASVCGPSAWKKKARRPSSRRMDW